MKNLSLKQASPLLGNPIYAACRSTWAEVRPAFANLASTQGITQPSEESRVTDPLEDMMRMFSTGRPVIDPAVLKNHESLFLSLSNQRMEKQKFTSTKGDCELCNDPDEPVFILTDPTTGSFYRKCSH